MTESSNLSFLCLQSLIPAFTPTSLMSFLYKYYCLSCHLSVPFFHLLLMWIHKLPINIIIGTTSSTNLNYIIYIFHVTCSQYSVPMHPFTLVFYGYIILYFKWLHCSFNILHQLKLILGSKQQELPRRQASSYLRLKQQRNTQNQGLQIPLMQ